MLQVTVERQNMVEALSRVLGAVERKQIQPILANVLLQVEDGWAAFTTTDMEIELHTRTESETITPGAITLSARKLYDLCRTLPSSARITLSQEQNHCRIISDSSRFTLQTLPPEEFPALDVDQTHLSLDVPSKRMRYLIDKTKFAMANQDMRSYLNGLLLEVRGNSLRAIATNGHRLAVAEQPMDTDSPDDDTLLWSGIVPKKAILELARQISSSEGDIRIKMAERYLMTTLGTARLSSKLLEGRYPPYQNVLPQSAHWSVFIESTELLAALQRVTVLADEQASRVKLTIKPGLIHLVLINPSSDSAEDTVSAQYDGPETDIYFNAAYLIEALSALEDNPCVLHFNDASSACLWQMPNNNQCLQVVMPIRI